MKSDSEIMTAIAYKSDMLRQLSKEESRLLKETLVRMFTDLDNLCRENNLDLILVGGSALGAARHKGFIPWDDDLDVALSRDHYDRLLELLKIGKLGTQYEYTFPSEERDSKNLFLKVYRKGTVNSEVLDEYTPFPKGIFLDVFPIENAWRPGFMNTLKSGVSKVLSFISVSVLYYQYRSTAYKEFMSQSDDGKKRYKLRMRIGKLASIIDHSKWAWGFDRFVRMKRFTGFVTIPTGRKGYKGETLPFSSIFPVAEAKFEDVWAKVPGNLDLYLKNLYGDYMTIPPVEKRERHYVMEIKF